MFYGVIAGILALAAAAAFTGAALQATLGARPAGEGVPGDRVQRGFALAAMALGLISWWLGDAGLALAGVMMLAADLGWCHLVMADPEMPGDLEPDEAARLLGQRRARLAAVRPAIGGWAVLFFLLAVTLG